MDNHRAGTGLSRYKKWILLFVLWGVMGEYVNTYAAYALHNTQSLVYLGDTPVRLIRYQSSTAGITYYHPHSDEKTALIVAKNIIVQYGGKIIDLSHGNNNTRLIFFRLQKARYAIDPNRIFSASGIVRSLKKHGAYSKSAAAAVQGLSEAILSALSPFSLLVAVHNNLSQGFSLRYYLPGGLYHRGVKAIYRNPALSMHTLVIVTNQLLFDFLKNQKINVVLQDNEKVRDDGSLSYYAGKNKFLYANVETVRGNEKEQGRLLRTLNLFFESLKNK